MKLIIPITLVIAFIIWFVVGPFFWFPSVAVATARYSTALIVASLNNTNISSEVESSLERATTMYINGFEQIKKLRNYSNDKVDNEQPDNRPVLRAFMEQLFVSTIFWVIILFSIFMIFYL